jgi:hypothetical protein
VIATRGPDPPPGEQRYRLCDVCGYYGRPTVFTSTYIIFFLAGAYHRHHTRPLCNACMRAEALKMLLVNTPFVIGIPWVSVALVRAYFGGSALSPTFGGLDSANRAVRKKKYRQAEELYERILQRLPHAAGVRYNKAKLHAEEGDWERCLDEVVSLWADCANYGPALPLASQAMRQLGRAADAEALEQQWKS